MSSTGCGTSEHAAMAGAALLGRPRARRVRGARSTRRHGGVLIAVSHEAGTAATLAALAADAARARSLITASRTADGADIVVRTPLTDTSWCHTVGYVSPLLAFDRDRRRGRRGRRASASSRTCSPSATRSPTAADARRLRAADRRRLAALTRSPRASSR